MKAKNLEILKNNKINVPKFIVVEDEEKVDLSFSEGNIFSVRSSFESEDNNKNSYAGQFETFLNVKRNDVKNAIIKVKESYNGAKDYEKIKNIKGDKTKAKVIVQEMIQSDFSGVIFTINPIGILNETVITIGKGTGDNVVEDRTETSTYYYNNDEKLFYLRQKAENLVNNKILNELVNLSKKIKNIFDREMDIEFAIKDDIIYILQARPITTIHNKKTIILDNSNIVESYPGISLPLTQGFVHDIYRDVFKSCVYRVSKDKELVNKMANIFDNLVTTYDGSIYYQINNWYEILHLLPFSKKIIKIWQEMLGVSNDLVNKGTIKVTKYQKIKIFSHFVYYLIATPNKMKKLNNYFEKIYPEYLGKIGKTEDVEELLKLFKSIEESVTSVWDITLVNDMFTFIFTHLSGGKKNLKISNIENIESMKPIIAMNKLIKIASIEGTESNKYTAQQQKYISLYGDRCLGELKLETKTYRSNPETLLEYVESRKNKFIQVSKDSNKKIKSFNLFVKLAKSGISNREKSRLNRTRLFGLAREIILKIGTILQQNNQIEQKEDIFYLYEDEINIKNKYQELINKRKQEYDDFEKMPHPHRLVFANKIIANNKRTIYKNQFQDIDVLRGNSTSIGKIKGEVIVINKISKSIDTNEKIIVTKSTDPGWVFLLENCLGIIAEQGSVLSHTAIISRELKKPAIVNVKDATKILSTGDFIELNAYTGEIKILKRGVKYAI